MSTDQVDMFVPQGGINGRAGQATMVEASRAVEEVRALVIVARQFPRDVPAALRRIDEIFQVESMAKRSFFSYRRGGSNIAGSTIHLAKAVAAAWGNVTYGLDELSRRPEESEMRAWAWDLETNQRVSTTFIVPHAMDAGSTVKKLTDLRSIYENNTNAGNRRLRSQIESVIPAFVMDAARERASQTVNHGGGVPLPVRIQEIIRKFEETGVDLSQLEEERGRSSGLWSAIDVAHLTVIGESIGRGERRAEDAFPARVLSVADVVPQQSAATAPPVVVNQWAGVEYPEPVDGESVEGVVWPPVTPPGGVE